MNIAPRIETILPKKLVGINLEMNNISNKTMLLWQKFMPLLPLITNRINTHKISLQIYPSTYFYEYKPTTLYTKWALVEVTDFSNIANNLKAFTLNSGMYAVFNYKGLSTDTSIFNYIFTEWLPQSKFNLDNRPHFEVLGEKYKNNDPNSEEEIWIPIKSK